MSFGIAGDIDIPRKRIRWTEATMTIPCPTCEVIAQTVIEDYDRDLRSLTMIGAVVPGEDEPYVMATGKKYVMRKYEAGDLEPHTPECLTGQMIKGGFQIRIGIAYATDPERLEVDFMPMSGQIYVPVRK